MSRINMVIKCLSTFEYDKYLKRRKIMNVYDRKGIPGLQQARYTKGSRFHYMLNLRVRLCNSVEDSLIMTSVLMVMCRPIELFYYLLPFIAHHQNGIASNNTKLIHILSSSDDEEQAIPRIDYYLRNYKVDINCCDAFGRNCLFYVRCKNVFDYLIEKGARQDERDHDGLRPFEYMILANNMLYRDILYTPEQVTDAFAFIMRTKGSTATHWIANLTAHIPGYMIAPQVQYDCFIFLGAVGFACTSMAAEMFTDANIIARHLHLPQVPDHMPELLDFIDAFLVSKCMKPLDENRVRFLELVAYNSLSPTGQIEEPQVSWKLCYERLLDLTLSHPSETFNPHVKFLGIAGSFISTLSREKRMFYLDKLLNVSSSWSYSKNRTYIIVWIYKCYSVFGDNIEERLYNWIQPIKEQILSDVIKIVIHEQLLGVQFMSLCLSFGAIINHWHVKLLTLNVTHYTHSLLEALVSYKLPTIMDMESFNRLRWFVGPQKAPIPSLQSFCINHLKCTNSTIPPHVDQIIKNVS